jgi:glyoxylase-like metal-dependent hydrolase (beta-lactamase superfamily II)
MQTWNIGSTTVTRIGEQIGPSDFVAASFLPQLVRDRFERHLPWLVPTHYDPTRDRLITSNHAWLVRTGRHTILIDSCAGNHKERPWMPRFHQLDTPFLSHLREAGAAPESIDFVLCTHLHVDHVGWNTRLVDGRWIPTFPNARYLFSRIENDAWRPDGGTRRHEVAGASAAMYDDSVLPVIQAGQAQLLDGAHAIDDQLLIEPAPGHTPGHVVLKLKDGADGAVFCGDAVHHPIQVYEPSWNSRFCEDPVQAELTRRAVFEHCSEHRALLFPTHFAAPHVAAIEEEGGRFRPRFMRCAC